MNAIEISGLTKRYRRLRGPSSVAVASLDLAVAPGGVFGFLGPNGSGKTTTIRCLLGLVAPDEGECRLFGHDVRADLHHVIARIGALVEAPALFPTFSGRRNLDLLAAMGGLPPARVDEVLELVDLKDAGGDLVRSYSLGMRQRLGIGAALLKDPQLLILDEPANGLDPAGIKDVRHLLRRLGDEGRTVFVSSHILSEVQQTCDRVAILARGRCVAVGAVDEVLAHGRAQAVLVKVGDQAAAVTALRAAGLPCSNDNGYIVVEVDADRGAHVAQVLAAGGVYPSELRPQAVDLETVFLQLTGEEVAA